MGRADFDVIVDLPICAGSKLTGAVYIDVTKQISGSALKVRLQGHEKTRVTYKDGDWSTRKHVPKRLKGIVKGIQGLMSMASGENNRYKRRRSKDSSCVILQAEIAVGTQDMIANKKIEPGKYKLPFEIDLPDSLPSTFEIQEDRCRCSVSYHMKAQLEGSGWFSDYKTQRNIFIQAKAPEENAGKVPFEGPPESMPIKFLYCYPMGDMTYAAMVENTVLGCGKSVEVRMSCRNDSQLGVKAVIASLVQMVHWEAGGFDADYEKVIHGQNFGSWEDLNPITKEEARQRSVTTRDLTCEKQEIWNDLQAGAHKVNVTVPLTAIPTYEGTLISVKHFLRLRLVSTVFVDALAPCPKVEIPLQILGRNGMQSNIPGIALPAFASDVALIVANSAVVAAQDIQFTGAIASGEGDEIAPAEPVHIEGEPSATVLIATMQKSSNQQDLIYQKIEEKSWESVFSSLVADDFGSVLGAIDMDFQKVAIAHVLAQKCLHFTCAHVVAAMKSCPEWMRSNMVTQLIPSCNDLKENQNIIKNAMSEWDKTVTASAFEDVLRGDNTVY